MFDFLILFRSANHSGTPFTSSSNKLCAFRQLLAISSVLVILLGCKGGKTAPGSGDAETLTNNVVPELSTSRTGKEQATNPETLSFDERQVLAKTFQLFETWRSSDEFLAFIDRERTQIRKAEEKLYRLLAACIEKDLKEPPDIPDSTLVNFGRIIHLSLSPGCPLRENLKEFFEKHTDDSKPISREVIAQFLNRVLDGINNGSQTTSVAEQLPAEEIRNSSKNRYLIALGRWAIERKPKEENNWSEFDKDFHYLYEVSTQVDRARFENLISKRLVWNSAQLSTNTDSVEEHKTGSKLLDQIIDRRTNLTWNQCMIETDSNVEALFQSYESYNILSIIEEVEATYKTAQTIKDSELSKVFKRLSNELSSNNHHDVNFEIFVNNVDLQSLSKIPPGKFYSSKEIDALVKCSNKLTNSNKQNLFAAYQIGITRDRFEYACGQTFQFEITRNVIESNTSFGVRVFERDSQNRQFNETGSISHEDPVLFGRLLYKSGSEVQTWQHSPFLLKIPLSKIPDSMELGGLPSETAIKFEPSLLAKDFSGMDSLPDSKKAKEIESAFFRQLLSLLNLPAYELNLLTKLSELKPASYHWVNADDISQGVEISLLSGLKVNCEFEVTPSNPTSELKASLSKKNLSEIVKPWFAQLEQETLHELVRETRIPLLSEVAGVELDLMIQEDSSKTNDKQLFSKKLVISLSSREERFTLEADFNLESFESDTPKFSLSLRDASIPGFSGWIRNQPNSPLLDSKLISTFLREGFVKDPHLQGRIYDDHLELKFRGGVQLLESDNLVDIDTGWLRISVEGGEIDFSLPENSQTKRVMNSGAQVRFPSGLVPQITRKLSQSKGENRLALNLAISSRDREKPLNAGKITLQNGKISFDGPTNAELKSLSEELIADWMSEALSSIEVLDLLFKSNRDFEESLSLKGEGKQLSWRWQRDQLSWRLNGVVARVRDFLTDDLLERLEAEHTNLIREQLGLTNLGQLSDSTTLKLIRSDNSKTLRFKGTSRFSFNDHVSIFVQVHNLEIDWSKLKKAPNDIGGAIIADTLDLEIKAADEFLSKLKIAGLGVFQIKAHSIRYQQEQWHLNADLFFAEDRVVSARKLSFNSLEDLATDALSQMVGREKLIFEVGQRQFTFTPLGEPQEYAFSIDDPVFASISGQLSVDSDSAILSFDNSNHVLGLGLSGLKLKLTEGGKMVEILQSSFQKELEQQLNEKVIQILNTAFSEFESETSEQSSVTIKKFELESFSLSKLDYRIGITASLEYHDQSSSPSEVEFKAIATPQEILISDLGIKLPDSLSFQQALLDAFGDWLIEYADEHGDVQTFDMTRGLNTLQARDFGGMGIRFRDVVIVPSKPAEPAFFNVNTRKFVNIDSVLFNLTIEQNGQSVDISTSTKEEKIRACRLTAKDFAIHNTTGVQFSGGTSPISPFEFLNSTGLDDGIVKLRIDSTANGSDWITKDNTVAIAAEAFILAEDLESLMRTVASPLSEESNVIRTIQIEGKKSSTNELNIAECELRLNLIDGFRVSVKRYPPAGHLKIMLDENVAKLGFVNLQELNVNLENGDTTAAGRFVVPETGIDVDTNVSGLEFSSSGLDISNASVDVKVDFNDAIKINFDAVTAEIKQLTPYSVSGLLTVDMSPLLSEKIPLDFTLKWNSGGVRLTVNGRDLVTENLKSSLITIIVEIANKELGKSLPLSLGEFRINSAQLKIDGDGNDWLLGASASIPRVDLHGLNTELQFEKGKWSLKGGQQDLRLKIINRVQAYLTENLEGFPMNAISANGFSLEFRRINGSENIVAFDLENGSIAPNLKLVLTIDQKTDSTIDGCGLEELEIASLDNDWKIKFEKGNIEKQILRCLKKQIEFKKVIDIGNGNSLFLEVTPNNISFENVDFNVSLSGEINGLSEKFQIDGKSFQDSPNREIDEERLFSVTGIDLNIPVKDFEELKDFNALFENIQWSNAKVKNAWVIPYLLMPSLSDWIIIEEGQVINGVLHLSGTITLPSQEEKQHFSVSIPTNGSRETLLLSLLNNILATLEDQTIESGNWALTILKIRAIVDQINGELKLELTVLVEGEWDDKPFAFPVTLYCSKHEIDFGPLEKAIEDFIKNEAKSLYASIGPVQVDFVDPSSRKDGFRFNVTIKVQEAFQIRGTGFLLDGQKFEVARTWKFVDKQTEILIPPIAIYDLGGELDFGGKSKNEFALTMLGKLTGIKKENGNFTHLAGSRTIKFITDDVQLQKIAYEIDDKLVFFNFFSQWRSRGELAYDFSKGQVTGTLKMQTEYPLKNLVDVDGDVEMVIDSQNLTAQGDVKLEAFGFAEQDANFNLHLNENGDFGCSISTSQKLPLINSDMVISVAKEGFYLEQTGDFRIANLKIYLSTFGESYVAASIPQFGIKKKFPIPDPNNAKSGLEDIGREIESLIASLPKLPDLPLDGKISLFKKKRKKGHGPGEKPKVHHPGLETEDQPKPENQRTPPGSNGSETQASTSYPPPLSDKWPLPRSETQGDVKFLARIVKGAEGDPPRYLVQTWNLKDSGANWKTHGHIARWSDAALNLPPANIDEWVAKKMAYFEVVVASDDPTNLKITFNDIDGTPSDPIDLDGVYHINLPSEPNNSVGLVAIKQVKDKDPIETALNSENAVLMDPTARVIQTGNQSPVVNAEDFIIRYLFREKEVLMKVMQVARNTRRIKDGSKYFTIARKFDKIVGEHQIDHILSWKPLAQHVEATTIGKIDSLHLETSPTGALYGKKKVNQNRGWLWEARKNGTEVKLISQPITLSQKADFPLDLFTVKIEKKSNRYNIIARYGSARTKETELKEDHIKEGKVLGTVQTAVRKGSSLFFRLNSHVKRGAECPTK